MMRSFIGDRTERKRGDWRRWTMAASAMIIAVLAALSLSFARAMAEGPDIVLINGKVFTCDAANSIHQAVAIADGRFAAVGTNEEIRALAGPSTKVIDLRGRLVLPGFIDAHIHPIGLGIPNYLDVSQATSIAEIRRALAEQAAETPAGQWIRGGGWLEENLAEQRAPTRWDIDEAAGDHPVILFKQGWHALLANSRALWRARITRETPDPPGGHIVRDPQTGEPTGLLEEAAMDLVIAVIPKRPTDTIEGLRQTCTRLLKYGITTAYFSSELPETLRAYQQLYRPPRPAMVRAIIRPWLYTTGRTTADLLAQLEGWPVISGLGNEWLRIGELKIFVDGGITTQSALMWKAYKGRPGYFGVQSIDKETLNAVVKKAHRLGWQIHFHTCGDRAIDLALDALEAAQKAFPRKDARHSLTHTYVISPRAIERLARLNVAVVVQPNFIYTLGRRFAFSFEEERLRRVIPVKTLLDHGVRVVFSSDNIPIGPLQGLYGAVHRVSRDGRPIGPEEEITIEQAIRLYTIAGAYLAFDERRKGSIEVGKLADAVVIDRDLLTVPVEEIRRARVDMTIVGGRIVYQR